MGRHIWHTTWSVWVWIQSYLLYGDVLSPLRQVGSRRVPVGAILRRSLDLQGEVGSLELVVEFCGSQNDQHIQTSPIFIVIIFYKIHLYMWWW